MNRRTFLAALGLAPVLAKLTGGPPPPKDPPNAAVSGAEEPWSFTTSTSAYGAFTITVANIDFSDGKNRMTFTTA